MLFGTVYFRARAEAHLRTTQASQRLAPTLWLWGLEKNARHPHSGRGVQDYSD